MLNGRIDQFVAQKLVLTFLKLVFLFTVRGGVGVDPNPVGFFLTRVFSPGRQFYSPHRRTVSKKTAKCSTFFRLQNVLRLNPACRSLSDWQEFQKQPWKRCEVFNKVVVLKFLNVLKFRFFFFIFIDFHRLSFFLIHKYPAFIDLTIQIYKKMRSRKLLCTILKSFVYFYSQISLSLRLAYGTVRLVLVCIFKGLCIYFQIISSLISGHLSYAKKMHVMSPVLRFCCRPFPKKFVQ